jgi:hypothetical protein
MFQHTKTHTHHELSFTHVPCTLEHISGQQLLCVLSLLVTQWCILGSCSLFLSYETLFRQDICRCDVVLHTNLLLVACICVVCCCSSVLQT